LAAWNQAKHAPGHDVRQLHAADALVHAAGDQAGLREHVERRLDLRDTCTRAPSTVRLLRVVLLVVRREVRVATCSRARAPASKVSRECSA
jgi:hypothetical protein